MEQMLKWGLVPSCFVRAISRDRLTFMLQRGAADLQMVGCAVRFVVQHAINGTGNISTRWPGHPSRPQTLDPKPPS